MSETNYCDFLVKFLPLVKPLFREIFDQKHCLESTYCIKPEPLVRRKDKKKNIFTGCSKQKPGTSGRDYVGLAAAQQTPETYICT